MGRVCCSLEHPPEVCHSGLVGWEGAVQFFLTLVQKDLRLLGLLRGGVSGFGLGREGGVLAYSFSFSCSFC